MDSMKYSGSSSQAHICEHQHCMALRRCKRHVCRRDHCNCTYAMHEAELAKSSPSRAVASLVILFDIVSAPVSLGSTNFMSVKT